MYIQNAPQAHPLSHPPCAYWVSHEITEVSDGGSVPELAFENASAGKILLVDGDELVGARQNRVVNISILVGGGQRVVIPVSCVEHGRWSYAQSAPGRHGLRVRVD